MRQDGFFTDKQPIFRAKVTGVSRSAVLNLAVDTGADPAVLLSEDWSTSLDLQPIASDDAILANGSKAATQLGIAEVEWLGEPRLIYVTIFTGVDVGVGPRPDSRPQRGGQANGLVGYGLLQFGRLTIDYINRQVSLENVTAEGA